MWKGALFIFGAFFCNSAFAVDVIWRDSRLYAVDPSCATLDKVVHSLSSWLRNERIKKSCAISQQGVENEGLCEKDITNCVPDHVLKYHGVYTKEGPNCFNLALAVKNILPGLRNSTGKEFGFYLNSPLCRALTNQEARLPGDIGAIYFINSDGSKGEDHGFIYISEEISYSKNGALYFNPYALQDFGKMLSSYGINKEQCAKNELNPDPSCKKSTAYFRCKSMKDYLESTPGLPAELLAKVNEIRVVERCFETLAVHPGDNQAVNPETGRARGEVGFESPYHGTSNGDLVVHIKNSMPILLKFLEKEREENERNGMLNEDVNFLLGSLQMRVAGIMGTFTYAGPTDMQMTPEAKALWLKVLLGEY